MKKRFTFNHLLHKDKLMMVLSLILAIVLWAWADYEQGNMHEITIDNVPVQVELSSYATKSGLKIVEGADVTATVRVRGTRANLRGIKAQDVRLVADASGVYTSDIYKATLSVSTSKKCEILDVFGDNVFTDKVLGKYINITCKMFVEEQFDIATDQVDISNLSVSDKERMRFDNCEITDATKVTVHGVYEDVARIRKVCAVIPNAKELSMTEHFTAKLVAYDADGNVVENITFTDPSSGEVGVIVPVVVYREEALSVTDLTSQTPQALADKLVVNPATIVLGELSEKKVLDAYLENIREKLTVNFDHWLAEANKPITQTVVTLKEKDDIEQKDGVYLDRAENQITITLNVEGYTNQTKDIELVIGENVNILCDDGFVATLKKDAAIRVTLCGPKKVLDEIDASQIRITIDAKGQPEGPHTVSVRPEVNRDDVWVYYGAADAAVVYEIEYTIVKAEVAAIAE